MSLRNLLRNNNEDINIDDNNQQQSQRKSKIHLPSISSLGLHSNSNSGASSPETHVNSTKSSVKSVFSLPSSSKSRQSFTSSSSFPLSLSSNQHSSSTLANDSNIKRNPSPTFFPFPTEILPASAIRTPYPTQSITQSDPVVGKSARRSAPPEDMNQRPLKELKKQPSTNSGAINQRNHVRAKNMHANVLVQVVQLLHERCETLTQICMDSNPMDNEFLPTVPPLPERWQERNQGAVKERLYAAKELYAALANHEWIDEE